MQSFGYELLYILPGITSQDELARIIMSVGEILKKEGASILRHELWSERRLAYRIKQSDTGKYILCYFKISPDALPRIEQTLRRLTVLSRHRILKHENVEAAMNTFFAYEGAMLEKRRAAIARPKERRFEHARLQELIVQPSYPPSIPESARPEKLPEPAPEHKREEKPEPEQQKEERIPEETSDKAPPAAEEPKKKRSLAELDQKLDKLLEGELEL